MSSFFKEVLLRPIFTFRYTGISWLNLNRGSSLFFLICEYFLFCRMMPVMRLS